VAIKWFLNVLDLWFSSLPILYIELFFIENSIKIKSKKLMKIGRVLFDIVVGKPSIE
jgi:hypothetical protein